MKGMLIGLAAGMVAGAIIAKTCKPCSRFIDDMSEKCKSMGKKNDSGSRVAPSQEECECGSDCDCGYDCNCGE